MNAPVQPPVKWRYRLLSAAAGIAVVAAIAGAGWHGYRSVLARPFQRVLFAGDLDRLAQADLDALSRSVQAAESPDLDAVREAARKVPWVRSAQVRRIYPDIVEITFEAHQAYARWNDHQLVSVRGEVFTAEGAGKLVRLRGPDGSAALLAAELPQVVAALAPLGSPVAELRLSARGAREVMLEGGLTIAMGRGDWRARADSRSPVAELRLSARGAREVMLEGGLTIAMGRGDWRARAQRFTAAWAGVAEGARASRYADLRYPNGFALRTAMALPPARTPSARPAPTAGAEPARGGKPK